MTRRPVDDDTCAILHLPSLGRAREETAMSGKRGNRRATAFLVGLLRAVVLHALRIDHRQ
jgi:hypothetical protein